ncbi:glycosyltransferase family 4 protein [Salinisphaera sp. C84B14]|uniref:glycosyltransferase family 4 protein n=1 Tax=Salinisphaera sp. C84B14 TaxID=1304155 RepID=UPI00333EB3C5
MTLLSKYSRLGASSRLRSLQFCGFLHDVGLEITVRPLFNNFYLENLYAGKGRSISAIACLYAARVRCLREASGSDLLWVEKEALPFIPYRLERALMPKNVPYVVDYDDAVFHNYDSSRHALVRKLLGHKIDRVMAGAATVICGNRYLAARATRAGARHIRHIPTVVDAARYMPVPNAGNVRPVIGWIGSPSTQKYVLALRAVFERLYQTHPIRLVLVGARPELAQQFGPVPVEVLPWAEDTEAHHVASFDIGIMPLPDKPWERGKCGYKLIQYMACAKPVVASPVGVNTEIVEGWDCGLLAEGDNQWFVALDRLLSQTGGRVEFGRRGRLAVESHYSLQAQAPNLACILRNAAGMVE